jgi:hypothetical protein
VDSSSDSRSLKFLPAKEGDSKLPIVGIDLLLRFTMDNCQLCKRSFAMMLKISKEAR